MWKMHPKVSRKTISIQKHWHCYWVLPVGESDFWKNGEKQLQNSHKVMKMGTFEEVIEHLIALLTNFSIHNLTNINQLQNFKQAKKNLKPN